MAASALPMPPADEPATIGFDAAEFWLAAATADSAPDLRHSRRVALLKRVLPAVGVALLLLIMMWPRLAPLWERMRFAFPAIDLRDARELRMVNPRYAGNDRLGHPYVVTAATGRQVPDRQDLMSLESPRADVKTHSGADIVLTAKSGIYQSQTQLLDLFGEVTLVHQNGTRLVTSRARIDVAGSTAEGNEAVTGHGPSGDLRAEGFRVADRGDTIFLTGKSDMLLHQARPEGDKAAPAGLPDTVASVAAQVGAAAKPALAEVRPHRQTAHQAAARTAASHAKPAANPKLAAAKKS